MAKATLGDRLRHMMDAIEAVVRHADGKSFDQYLADELLRRAVERWLEIVSEASRHVPEELKDRYPEVPWRAVADFGNVLRHGYAGVIDRRVFEIIGHDLPVLKRVIGLMLREVADAGRDDTP